MGAVQKVRSNVRSAVKTLMIMGLAVPAFAGDRFFVSDRVAKQVYKYDDSFAPNTNWATAVANGSPDDVYITATEVYVLDSVNKKVFRYDYAGGSAAETGTLKVVGTAASADIGTPVGMSVDPDANELWVADSAKGLYRYSLSGAFSAATSVNAASQYTLRAANTAPHGLSLDDTYVYILDRDQERIFRYLRTDPAGPYTPSRKLRTETGTKLTQPEGMAVAGDFLYVLNNSVENRVHLYSMFNVFLDPTEENSFISYPLAAGNNDPFGLGIDKTRSAVSILPSTFGPTNADSISFNVIFDKPVVNFNDTSDVIINHNGTASTGVTITGSGDTYTLTVDGLTGDGPFTVEINTASDILDTDGVGLIATATSPAVLIDNIAPRADLLTPNTGTQIDITYTELNEMGAAALLPATYTASGPGLGTLLANPSSVTDLGGNVYRLEWAAGSSINGQTLTINVDPTLTDLAGNVIDQDYIAPAVTAVPVSLSGFTVE